jgi:hypothetical protein
MKKSLRRESVPSHLSLLQLGCVTEGFESAAIELDKEKEITVHV